LASAHAEFYSYICLHVILQIIIPDDVEQRIYISTDEGVTYTGRDVPVAQTLLMIHPTQNGWMIGLDFSHVGTL